ncbi:PREDICTED: uncharacterized protein LOC109479420 [Branchiostoma belcheri]|uniref:Uncharacterized protein LOC109479420 n=1 Tax=Branchiostoma belcheri TaxID=7741 RepID=A0A6P4ZJJ3_BRABE|nr:PREDICTED: uncharacterized protein LOC109479420 [Branchiostoma belcheri]
MHQPEVQLLSSASTAPGEKDNEDTKEVCPGSRQLFVKDLHGNTRCVDVQQETTVADLTIQLEAEKILPPGGSLMAGSKKLKKTQLMSEVPSNIEVVLALRGGAPAGKLSINVQERKDSKIRAEDLRKKIEEDSGIGKKLSKQQLGRILRNVYKKKFHRVRIYNPSNHKRDYYYDGLKMKVAGTETDGRVAPQEHVDKNVNESVLAKEKIQALEMELSTMKERTSELAAQLAQQSKTIYGLKEENTDLLNKVMAVNEDNDILYKAVSKHTAESFLPSLADFPSDQIFENDRLVQAHNTVVGRGAYGQVCKLHLSDVGTVAVKTYGIERNGQSAVGMSKRHLLKEANMLRALQDIDGVQKLVGIETKGFKKEEGEQWQKDVPRLLKKLYCTRFT